MKIIVSRLHASSTMEKPLIPLVSVNSNLPSFVNETKFFFATLPTRFDIHRVKYKFRCLSRKKKKTAFEKKNRRVEDTTVVRYEKMRSITFPLLMKSQRFHRRLDTVLDIYVTVCSVCYVGDTYACACVCNSLTSKLSKSTNNVCTKLNITTEDI